MEQSLQPAFIARPVVPHGPPDIVFDLVGDLVQGSALPLLRLQSFYLLAASRQCTFFQIQDLGEVVIPRAGSVLLSQVAAQGHPVSQRQDT